MSSSPAPVRRLPLPPGRRSGPARQPAASTAVPAAPPTPVPATGRTAARTTVLSPALITGLTVLMGLLLGVLGATPAAAHDTIESSNPADGATVATVPATVTLTFDEQPQDFSPVMQVTGPDGADWAAGTPTISGTDVSVPVRAGAPAGAWTVAYRIVSSDGHPVTGQLTFTAEAAAAAPAGNGSSGASPTAAPPSAAASTAAASSPTVPGSTASTASVSTGPQGADPATTVAIAPAAGDADTGSGTPGWVIALIVAAVVVGVGVAVVLLRRTRANRTVR